jgi:hypothetical protein
MFTTIHEPTMEKDFIGDLSRTPLIDLPVALRSTAAAPCGACRTADGASRSDDDHTAPLRPEGAVDVSEMPRTQATSEAGECVDTGRRTVSERVRILVRKEWAGDRRRVLDAVTMFARRRLLNHA